MAVPSCCQPKLHDQRLWEQSLLEEQLRPKANVCVVELALCLLCTEKKIKTISQIYELSFFILGCLTISLCSLPYIPKELWGHGYIRERGEEERRGESE